MPTTHFDQAIAAIADDHHGLISNRLARAGGIPAERLLTRCRSGSLIRVEQGLYRVSRNPVTWHQRLLAAVWLQGPHAAASHRSAAILHGLEPVGGRSPIELVVPRWDRRMNRSNAWLHESKDLLRCDLTVVDRIPCTTAVRTLVDLPAVLSENDARLVLDQAFRRDLCPIEEVTDRFVQTARRGRNGTRVGRMLLEERLGVFVPTMSEFEERVAAIVEGAGMPSLSRQVPVRVDGGTDYVDLGWPDLQIGIECAGLTRRALASDAWDRDRVGLFAAAGWTVIGLTWEAATATPDLILEQVRTARERRSTRSSASRSGQRNAQRVRTTMVPPA